MKKQTFLQLSLLFPYILWVVLASFMGVMSEVFPASESLPVLSGIITISFMYTFGILVWGIPYTILALGLWIWSKGKTIHTTVKVFALSPLMMAVIVVVVMYFLLSADGNVSSDFGELILALSTFSILYGYGIIGMIAGLYKFLQMKKLIEPDNEAPPVPTT